MHQTQGRRLTIGIPGASLLLRKATAELAHGGGRLLTVDSEDYRTLVHWISLGAPRRIENEATLVNVSLEQSEFTLTANETAPLQVTATYSDGTTRDVTSLATYLANDSAVAEIDAAGEITAGTVPGETAIMARYMNEISVALVSIPRSKRLPDTAFESLPRNDFIDELVYEKLRSQSIKVSDAATDAEFLRRVYTDVIGRIPTSDEAQEFLDSDEPEKREQLVERLLQDPSYVDHWSNLWADLLRPNPYRVGIKAVLNYDQWIRDQFRSEATLDQFATRLITAKGSTWRNGAVTLFRDRRSPDEVITLVSQLFLGIRLECAKCHHHPFERWSQEDFYSLAAYFAKVGRKGTGLSPPISGSEEIIYVAGKGSVSHPVTGETLVPRPLFGTVDESLAEDPRESLASWITSKENPYFAGVMANRIWSLLMGRGLVEPVDDFRSTNPATNRALLDALAKHLQDADFDQKSLIRSIVLSHAYSLSSTPSESNASDRLNYSRHYRHRLRGEILADAIADVTESNGQYAAMPPDSRANQIWTHRVDSMFLDTFGRPNENQDPPCERTADSSVTQSLHLMNAKDIDGRIRDESGRAVRLAKSELSPSAIVNELYLATFSRYPTEHESGYATELIRAAGEKRLNAIEDLMWAMLNSPEFVIQN